MNVKSKHQMFLITRNAFGLLMMGGMVLCPVTMNATVKQTHHDFSTEALGTKYSNELCNVCHTPHHAKDVKQLLLWNHTVTEASYTLYSSPTMDATAPSDNLGGVLSTSISKLCLSCHDGTVAVDAFGVQNGTTVINPLNSFPAIGSTTNPLKSHHPVGIRYDSALAEIDPKLKNPNTSSSGLGGTISHDLLNGGVLECSSCHDVHVARLPDPEFNCALNCHNTMGGSLAYFRMNTKSLVIDNAQSALCFTCHDK